VGKPLRNGGSYFLRKRRGTKLERGGRLVNGTFVVSGAALPLLLLCFSECIKLTSY